jgi:hypothetical protein
MIKISEDFELSSDSEQWILRKRVKAGKRPGGKEQVNEYKWLECYFGSLDKALKHVVNEDLKKSESLEDMGKRLNDLRTLFSNVFSFVFL